VLKSARTKMLVRLLFVEDRKNNFLARLLTLTIAICGDSSDDSVPPERAKNIVTLTLYGPQHCKGFFDAALAGEVISGQNQCNSVKVEFASECCNKVDQEANDNRVPGPVGTPPPSIAHVGSLAPTVSNFEKSCAALTNSTGNCGGCDRANGLCSDRSCCSQYGWCGTTTEYCKTDPLYSSRGGTKAIKMPMTCHNTSSVS
jgi:hypothetical protein